MCEKLKNALYEFIEENKLPKSIILRSYWHYLFDAFDNSSYYSEISRDKNILESFIGFCVVNKCDIDWSFQVLFYKWLVASGYINVSRNLYLESCQASVEQWTLFNQTHYVCIILRPDKEQELAYLGNKGRCISSKRKINCVILDDRNNLEECYQLGDSLNNFTSTMLLNHAPL